MSDPNPTCPNCQSDQINHPTDTTWQCLNCHTHYDDLLGESLKELAEIAKQIGAEGVWLIRGAEKPTLHFSWPHARLPEPPPDLTNLTTNFSLNLAVAEAGVIVLMRFPASDGAEPGIEHS